MNKKINSYIVLIACILIILPFYGLNSISNTYINMLVRYAPAIIGCLLFLYCYKLYNHKQKRLVKITIIVAIINMISFFLSLYIDDIGYFDFNITTIIICITFYISFFVQRILAIISCIKIMKNKEN